MPHLAPLIWTMMPLIITLIMYFCIISSNFSSIFSFQVKSFNKNKFIYWYWH